MSDTPVEAEAPPAEAAPAEAPVCPITDEFLPPHMRKHVDPKAPKPLRMMAAKGLVPLSPSDMAGALFMLMYDVDEAIRDTAGKTASSLADRIAVTAFRDETHKPVVLGWYLEVFATNDQYAEILILNPTTPDEAVASVASRCGVKAAEIIGQNQLRLLRHDDIIRGLAQNPVAEGALIDNVCDFAVRNGLMLADVPQMVAAQVRVFGAKAAAPATPEAQAEAPPPSPTAAEVMEEFNLSGENETAAPAPPLEEGKRLTLAQRVQRMSVSEKIKLASKGNKEVRTMLIRDSNKLVCTAVVRSPRFTDTEAMTQAQNKVVNEEVLRIILNNREWMRKYPIRMALVKNPKVPAQMVMRMLSTLHEADVKSLSKDKNVPAAVRAFAKKASTKPEKPGGG